jgi:hydroxymethylglutaryl-CoA reductase
MAVPLGIADGFLIDGETLSLPLATEEPSVIAAAAFGARLAGGGGGFSTSGGEPVMRASIYLEGAMSAAEAALAGLETILAVQIAGIFPGLIRRGGGFLAYSYRRLPESGTLCVDLDIDVRDAMGANIVNTVAERLAPLFEQKSGGRRLMAILTNQAAGRLTRASCRIPLRFLRRPGLRGEEAARRIVLAAAIAGEDPARAVTHNKGIMNGISALALATGNDTRGIEAAAHAWAARAGRIGPLSAFSVEEGMLVGRLEIPLPFGTVGGAIGLHPAARASLALLGNPGAPRLARIAAALGLAQNLAALLALVGEGIQAGHMRLHALRVAHLAGARGAAVARIARLMADGGRIGADEARRLLALEGPADAGSGPDSPIAGM